MPGGASNMGMGTGSPMQLSAADVLALSGQMPQVSNSGQLPQLGSGPLQSRLRQGRAPGRAVQPLHGQARQVAQAHHAALQGQKGQAHALLHQQKV